MALNKTMNPVGTEGSYDPRDLQDNAKVLDLLINGNADFVMSRLGISLESYQKLVNNMKNSGGALAFATYESLLAFRPTTANVLGLDAQTGNYYYWNGSVWSNATGPLSDKFKSGLSEIQTGFKLTSFRPYDANGAVVPVFTNGEMKVDNTSLTTGNHIRADIPLVGVGARIKVTLRYTLNSSDNTLVRLGIVPSGTFTGVDVMYLPNATNKEIVFYVDTLYDVNAFILSNTTIHGVLTFHAMSVTILPKFEVTGSINAQYSLTSLDVLSSSQFSAANDGATVKEFYVAGVRNIIFVKLKTGSVRITAPIGNMVADTLYSLDVKYVNPGSNAPSVILLKSPGAASSDIVNIATLPSATSESEVKVSLYRDKNNYIGISSGLIDNYLIVTSVSLTRAISVSESNAEAHTLSRGFAKRTSILKEMGIPALASQVIAPTGWMNIGLYNATQPDAAGDSIKFVTDSTVQTGYKYQYQLSGMQVGKHYRLTLNAVTNSATPPTLAYIPTTNSGYDAITFPAVSAEKSYSVDIQAQTETALLQLSASNLKGTLVLSQVRLSPITPDNITSENIGQYLSDSQQNHYSFLASTAISGVDDKSERGVYWGVGTEGAGVINPARAGYSNGTAQADIRPITYEDGSPLIENNKLYYTVSTRTGGAGVGVLELDLGTSRFKLVGSVFTYTSGTLIKAQAAHIMCDRINGCWAFTVPTHDTDHKLYFAKSYNDLRFGVTSLAISILDYQNPTNGDEDGFIFYDKTSKKWFLVYVSNLNTKNDYYITIQSSDSPYSGYSVQRTSIDNATSATGITVTNVGGIKYVISGANKDASGNNTYTAFKFDDLTVAGNLNYDFTDGGWRGWGTVTPIPHGNKTKYLFVTFDRIVSSNFSYWTYGTLYIYEATQLNNGQEFDRIVNGVSVPANPAGGTPLTGLTFKRKLSRRYCLDQELIVSEIDLSADVFLTNSNTYPQVGSLAYTQDNEVITTTGTGVGTLIAGVFHPLADYTLSMKGMATGNISHLSILDKSGASYFRVKFSQGVDDIVVSTQSSNSTTENTLGTIPNGVEVKLLHTTKGFWIYYR